MCSCTHKQACIRNRACPCPCKQTDQQPRSPHLLESSCLVDSALWLSLNSMPMPWPSDLVRFSSRWPWPASLKACVCACRRAFVCARACAYVCIHVRMLYLFVYACMILSLSLSLSLCVCRCVGKCASACMCVCCLSLCMQKAGAHSQPSNLQPWSARSPCAHGRCCILPTSPPPPAHNPGLCAILLASPSKPPKFRLFAFEARVRMRATIAPLTIQAGKTVQGVSIQGESNLPLTVRGARQQA